MKRIPQVRLLPDGRRLHLQDGPIDLIVEAFGLSPAVTLAHRAAARRFDGLLDELCTELPLLRRHAETAHGPRGTIAARMHQAVLPFAADLFITPMAAVAGAVADAVLAAMTEAADLDRAYVNNGGDIALHCTKGNHFVTGLIDRPDRPSLFGRALISGADPVRGIATSGWRGRSFSLGIADSVTVLARDAAMADAAATVIANAVDLRDHPAVHRVPAHAIQVDTDLGDRAVTRGVGTLGRDDRCAALEAGLEQARGLLDRDLISGAALHLQGETRVAGTLGSSLLPAEPGPIHRVAPNPKVMADA